ncbi:MAG: methionyl-tRNA formyltransferase [Lachnospiraceae bacterium]
MKIIYMGTPEIAAVILKGIIKQGEDEVVLAVTQPDRPKGRGKEMAMSDVKKVALEEDIPVYQPEKIKNPECVEYLKQFEADIIIVAAFGQILSKEILELTPHGCINVHASLLPKYRGAAPIQWAILDGEETTGVTIMQMDEGLDTGDIILKKEIRVAVDETGGTLHDKLAEAGLEALLEALNQIKEGTAKRIPQGVTTTHYAYMLNKKMGRIDFTKSAVEIDRLIRGLNPWPSAYTFLDGKMIKIWDCMVTDHNSGYKPGEVYGIDKEGFYIAAGTGGLRVLSLQAEGKRAMTAGEFLRGNDLYGKRFE